MKKLLSFLLAVVMCVSFFGCAEKNKPEESSTQLPSANEKVQSICTVEIECKSILENEKNFKGDSALIPENGVFLNAVEIELTDGMTAYDAFVSVCEKNNINADIQDSQYGKYINGIGGINSGDCGGYSGWLYYVNGEMAMVGISEYKIQNGDKITFTYSCE